VVTHLRPLRASAGRADAADPGNDYRDEPRELIARSVVWRPLVAPPPRLVRREPDGSPAVVDLEWRPADLSAPSHLVSYQLGLRHGLVPSGTLLLLAEGAPDPANLLGVRTPGYRTPVGPDDPALAELRERLVATLHPGRS
jgi:hypothetical protein